LLKEIHHRVKNNLQIISSLINLQSRYYQDNKIKHLLREIKNRIKSIALVHENIYIRENRTQINFKKYINNLIDNLIHTYEVKSNIKIEKNIDESEFFPMEESVPCGLIINELVKNSIQHAFSNKKRGKITINFTHNTDENKINLIIKDNGIGLPKDIDYKNSYTLGLQLVDILTEQLNGNLRLENKEGTKFLIEFKLKEKNRIF
ncbi:MAG: sensor histidine kinase, partial [Spirochaetota bacterium]